MKKLLFILISLSLSNFLYSQNTFVEYDDITGGKPSKGQLIVNDSISYWDEKFDEQTIVITNPFFIKMNKEDKIYYTDELFQHPFYVKDSLHNMRWELTNDSMVILNETCNAAKTYFRGRGYVAYYTTALPYSDGPWKFGGLPGLILKVKSDDNLYQFTAVKIIRNYTQKVQPVNINGYTFLKWDEFVKEFISTIDKWIKLARSNGTMDAGAKAKVKIDAPEIIYPKVQVGDGISF